MNRPEFRIHQIIGFMTVGLLLLLSPPAYSTIFLPQLFKETAALPGPTNSSALFGATVAISGDIIVVGAPEIDSVDIDGKVFVFQRSGSTWEWIQTLDEAPDDSTYGGTLALDGSTLVVADDMKTYIYQWTGANFTLQQTLPIQVFDRSVAVQGHTLVIGSPGIPGENVRVFAYDPVTGQWSLQQTLSGNGTEFGLVVAIDGDTIVVSDPAYDDSLRNIGAIYFFERDGNSWTQQGGEIKVINPSTNEFLGTALAIQGDTAVIGARSRSTSTGAAYVFERTGTLWTQRQQILPAPPNSFAEFGSGVAIDGDTIVIGAQGPSPEYKGAAYVYFRSAGGTWKQERFLTSAAARPGERLGASVAFDSGTVVIGGYDCCPDKARYAAVFEEDLSDPLAVAAALRPYLFRPDALAANQNGDAAAFAYHDLLFSTDSSEGKIRAAVETMPDLYGADHLDLSLLVEDKLRQALLLSPDADELQDLLLDIYYHRIAAAQILAAGGLEDRDLARLDLPPPPLGEGVIDQEISTMESVLNGHRQTLLGKIAQSEITPGGYMDLLQDDLGLAPTGGVPLGYEIFRTLVPQRGLVAATEDGVPVIDCNNDGVRTAADAACSQLFDGYKDLVLLLGLLRDTGRSAAELARLYHMRGFMADLDEARTLIGEMQTLLFTQGNIYLGSFDSLDPQPGDPTGLAEAIAAFHQSLTELSTTAELLAGDANALGFEQDFLTFMQKRDDFVNLFDSYDIFEDFIDPGSGGSCPSSSTSPLDRALDEFTCARDSYDSFKGYEDQLAVQFISLNSSYDERLEQIAGVRRGQAGYETPEDNVGSEIWQQIQSIQAAQLSIDRNRQEIANLEQQIQIEIERRGAEQGINNAIQTVIIDYGNKQADLTESIGHIEAAQAATNGLFDLFSIENLTTGKAILGAINVAVQTAGEEAKGQLKAEKERLAALEEADIRSLEDQLLGVNSRARIKTWLLEMSTLAIDSQQASLRMRQEIGRLKALYDEKASLETRMDEANTSLVQRYFADPLHRLIFQNSTLRAAVSFFDAQRWIYFMARSLEYKWNRSFVSSDPAAPSGLWTLDSIYSLRNARELQDFYAAMVQYNQILESTPFEPMVMDRISLRKNIFGYQDGEMYPDPLTGQMVSTIDAFRGLLHTLEDENGNPRIHFSTVRQFPGRSLFLGPIFFSDGNVDSPGTTLDKIEWLIVQIPGNHSSQELTVRGDLRYAGTSYIRSQTVGQPDPSRADRIQNELTAYATRFWRKDLGSADPFKFVAEEPPLIPIQMNLNLVPPQSCMTPGAGDLIDIFQERSVATSDWELVLRPSQGGFEVLDVDEIDDIEIYVCHRWVSR